MTVHSIVKPAALVAGVALTLGLAAGPAAAQPSDLLAAKLPSDAVYHIKYPAGKGPGRLIMVEKAAPGDYLTPVRTSQHYRIAFTTKDSRNRPVVGTALLSQPPRANGMTYKSNGNRVWINSMYINGLSLRCSPTQNYRLFRSMEPTTAQMMEGVLAGLGVSNTGPQVRQFSVLTPDLLGNSMMYGANIASGRLILDAMRALQRDGKKLGYVDPTFVMQGFSGGAMASASAALQMTKYAPSLVKKTNGIFMGGTPVDMIQISERYRKNAKAAFYQKGNEQLAMGVGITIGLSRQYPELRRYFTSHLTKKGKSVVRTMSNMCLSEMVDYVKTNNMSMAEILTVNLLNNPVLDKYLSRESVRSFPYRPSRDKGVHHYFYHGQGDKDVSGELVQNMAASWARYGAWTQFMWVPSMDHITAQLVSIGPLLSAGAFELYRDHNVTVTP